MRSLIRSGVVKVGRYGKSYIYLHLSFFFTAALLAFPFWAEGTMSGLALGALFIATIFASFLLHELAHAVVARRYGVPTLRIDIYMFGGLVQLWHLPNTRRQDFAITLAGPLSNLAIALVAAALLAIAPRRVPELIELNGRLLSVFPQSPGLLEQLSRASLYLNLGLCVVNLIPAFPLDGGKLLYLVIDERWDPRTATLVVSGLGLVFACVSTFVLIGSALSGFPIWAPPSFVINWRAMQAARRGRGGWNAVKA